jgi:transposase InsO family protein
MPGPWVAGTVAGDVGAAGGSPRPGEGDHCAGGAGRGAGAVVGRWVVDERHRMPIGRPYLTVAIDVFSRCIVGLVVTLEAPSALSVGLCLANMVTDKRPWLERLAVEATWPMSGKPAEIYVDNAAEFKSEALRRGCDQHGIKIEWRPPGEPHFGGIVERVIGTLMEMVHELPGTTFSNTQQRGASASEKPGRAHRAGRSGGRLAQPPLWRGRRLG